MPYPNWKAYAYLMALAIGIAAQLFGLTWLQKPCDYIKAILEQDHVLELVSGVIEKLKSFFDRK